MYATAGLHPTKWASRGATATCKPCEAFLYVQVFVPSKDGKVKIPMFIVHRNDVKLDGNTSAYLYAYGGASAPPASIDVNRQQQH